MRTRNLISLGLLVLLAACGGGGGGQPTPPVTSYTLNGIVRTAGGSAIAGAQVLLGQSAALTDASGGFSFSNLPAGFYLASVQDGSGNFSCKQLQLSASNTTFTFDLPESTAGFAVTSVTPQLNSSSVELNSNITIEFNQPPNPDDLVEATEWFNPSLGETEVLFTAGNTVLILDPKLQLPLDQQVTIELPAGLTSAGGSALGHAVRWRFRTEATDNAPPQLIGTTPQDGSTSHPPNLSAVFEFNEPLAVSPVPAVSCTPETQLTAATSGRFLYVQPAGGWSPVTMYSLEVSGISDPAGNAATVAIPVSFTTGSQNAPADDIEPTWNRVDNTVVFASNRYGSYDIFQVAPDGTALVRLTALPGDERHPAVSRDGERLVFQYREQAGYWHIHSQRLDGTGESQQLTAGEANDQQPVFSNTISNEIVFISDRVDPTGIFQMNSDGSNLREVDRLFGSSQSNPAFHPLLDTQLLFTSNRAGSLDVWRKTVSAIDGSTINLNLTGDYLSREASPVFSPDASYILYVSDYSGVDELWQADADGAFPRQVTYFESDVADPALSPVAGSTDCIVSLPVSSGGRGLAVVDAVSGGLLQWITGGEATN